MYFQVIRTNDLHHLTTLTKPKTILYAPVVYAYITSFLIYTLQYVLFIFNFWTFVICNDMLKLTCPHMYHLQLTKKAFNQNKYN